MTNIDVYSEVGLNQVGEEWTGSLKTEAAVIEVLLLRPANTAPIIS